MVAFFKWIAKNKTKIALLYALKVLIFIPHIVEAQEAPLIYEVNAPTTTDKYNFFGKQILPGTGGFSTSTVGTLRMELKTGHPSTTLLGWQLWRGASHRNCDTELKTMAEWGMDSNYHYVDFPFSGSECEVYPNIGNYRIEAIPGSGGQGNIAAHASTSNDSHIWYQVYGTGTPPEIGGGESCEDPATRILSFTPEDNATTSNPVSFSLDACIDPDDLGTIKGVNISLHNIDQNVLLLGALSPNDIYLLDIEDIITSGYFSFSTSTIILAEGNYRIEACIERSYFFGFITNPFSGITDCESHQFVVGEPTFIGNISQRLWGDTNDFYEGLTATSSEALAATCNPLGGNFGIRECTAFLFIPDASSLRSTMEDARLGILSRAPWGYFTRVVTILNSTATTSLPSFTSTIQIGQGYDQTPETTTITIDPGDMLAGGGALLDSIEDPITNQSARDVFTPMVQLAVALAVIMTIMTDLTSSHKHMNEQEVRQGKLS